MADEGAGHLTQFMRNILFVVLSSPVTVLFNAKIIRSVFVDAAINETDCGGRTNVYDLGLWLPKLTTLIKGYTSKSIKYEIVFHRHSMYSDHSFK